MTMIARFLVIPRRLLLVLALLAVPPLLPAGAALAAPAPGAMRIVVPARDIMRGEVIGDSDLTFADITGTVLAPSTITKFETATGMQSRRLLRAGESLRAED